MSTHPTQFPPRRLDNLRIEIEPRRRRARISINRAAGTVLRAAVDNGPFTTAATGDVYLDLSSAKLWPGGGALLDVNVELMEGERVVESRRASTALRELSEKEGRFILNQAPIWLKGVLHGADYPAEVSAEDLERLCRRELEAARDMSFHLVICLGPPPQILCDLADVMGLMLGIQLDDGVEESSLEEIMLPYMLHPSVVLWRVVARGRVLAEAVHAIDPSRLILHLDTKTLRGAVVRPFLQDWSEYDDLELNETPPVDFGAESYARHVGTAGRLSIVSRVGFGGPAFEAAEGIPAARARLRAQEGIEARDLAPAFTDLEGLAKSARALQCDLLRYLIDAMRANQNLAGYFVDRLADGGDEFMRGVLDSRRESKPALETLKLVQKPVRPLIQMAQTNLAPRTESPVSMYLANEAKLDGRADMVLLLVGPTNQVLWKKKRAVRYPKHGKELWSGTVGASGSTGQHRLVVRLMEGERITAEASQEFYVTPIAEKIEVQIDVLDPRKTYQLRVQEWLAEEALLAPVHVIPPLGNTIRAYPENELLQVLAQVHGGAVGIVVEPPEDWGDLAQVLEGLPTPEPLNLQTTNPTRYHYAKLHPLFEGLPSRVFLRQPYRSVAPYATFGGMSDEDPAGCWIVPPAKSSGDLPAWANDFYVRRYGSGRLYFTHYRLLEQLGADPLVERMFQNLIGHAARRSVPPKRALTPERKAVEWLRRERNEAARRWMIIGEFPNNEGQGHARAYAPEQQIALERQYPGHYRVVNWRPWYSLKREGHALDLQHALTPGSPGARRDYGTAYAYAEFTSEFRHLATLLVESPNHLKIWLNSNLIHADEAEVLRRRDVEAFIKLGKNTLLVKVSKQPGPFEFSLNIEGPPREMMQLSWWK